MPLKLGSLFALTVLPLVSLAAERQGFLKDVHPITYKPLCHEHLSTAQLSLYEKTLGQDSYQLLNDVTPLSEGEVALAYQALIRKTSREKERFDIAKILRSHRFPKNSEYQLKTGFVPQRSFSISAPFLNPLLRHLRRAVSSVQNSVLAKEGPLMIAEAEIRLSQTSEEADPSDSYSVNMHTDGGYIAITISYIGTPTFVLLGSDILPVPTGVPFVFSGEVRQEAFPDLQATFHGEPRRLENRFMAVIRLKRKFSLD